LGHKRQIEQSRSGLEPAEAVVLVELSRRFILGVHEQGQWVGDETGAVGRAKKQTALSTKEAATRWATVAEVMGIPVVTLHPSTWRSRLKFRTGPRQLQKDQAMSFCRGRGWIIHNHDAAEAACIGLVAWLTHSREK
jgi:hypothetical protein